MNQEEFQKLVLEKLVSLETKVTTVESDLKGFKQKQDEIIEFHQTNLYDTIQYINKRTERTENKLDALNNRLFVQEAEIQGLKRIKQA